MRTAELIVTDRPVLGDLNLDSRSAVGHAPETIVLAGDKGCGKIALPELLYHAPGAANFFTFDYEAEMTATTFIEVKLDPDLVRGQLLIAHLRRLL